ncbi:MAG: lysozyme [Reyranella sp.]|uniref:lysozyme n=1 Tax=Reyranella sp. TaxID=1929291 RepID=UPI003D0C4341
MNRLVKLGAAALAATVALVGGFEGLRTRAYLDPVGIPTICYGETFGVEMGDVHSVEECKAMLVAHLSEFSTGMDRCITNPAVPDKTYIALLSFTYNVGVGAFCRSTLLRKLNAGDLVGACNELPRWNRAGGRVLNGLTIRRMAEKELCLEGLPRIMGSRA